MNRKHGLAVASTFFALCAAELLLRGPLRPELTETRDMAWQAQTRGMHIRLHQPDPRLIYVPRPNAAVEMDYGRAAFNAQQMRRSGTVPLQPERIRIAMIGDSLVWGDLLAEADTLPAQLETRMGVEVLNFGVTGYDTVQQAAWYRRHVRDFHPDVVVVVYCLNDTQIRSNPFSVYADKDERSRAQAEREWLQQVAPLRNETISVQWFRERGGPGIQLFAAVRHAFRWTRLFVLPGGYIDEYLLTARSPERFARVRGALTDLGEAIQADGARPVLVISPALYWWHRYQWDEIHDAVRAVAEDAGFEVIDPLEVWRGGDPAPYRFPGDNLHYTPYGAEQLAEIIAQRLREG
ncbi:MAG: SGNH/GDSL hydrolase family protein [Myxococcota bacterium]